jgi:rfaE bifunctional protein nucleotidyltransferase chain/domain
MKAPVPPPLVLDLDEAVAWREQARAEGRRVVLTNGVFDLLHRGHLEYLHRSAALGDGLIVAVNGNASVRALKGPNRPLNTEVDRAYALASLRCVAASFVFAGPRLADEIRALRPDVYTKAGDYTIATLDASEREALLAVGADIRIMPFISGHSTSALIAKGATATGG